MNSIEAKKENLRKEIRSLMSQIEEKRKLFTRRDQSQHKKVIRNWKKFIWRLTS